MKNKKLLSLLTALCLVLTSALWGCASDPSPADASSEAPTETTAVDPVLTAYSQARTAVDSAEALTLKITITKTTAVGGETFTEASTQTLLCAGLGTDAVRYSSHEEVSYDSAHAVTYDEIFTDGTLYVTLDGTYAFSGTLTAEECALRYAPAVLLDAALYGKITQDGSTLTFAAPTAGESWAVPEGAELLDASGTAVLGSEGTLERTSYSAAYTYGSAEITLEAEVSVTAGQVIVEAPADPGSYTALEYVDAPRLAEMGLGYFYEAETVSHSSLESIMSYAGGVIRNQSTTVNSYGTGENFQAKVEHGVYVMDYSTNQDQEYEQEELFRDGEYSMTVDGGEPQSSSTVSAEMMEAYCFRMRTDALIAYDYWQDAKITDLGSLLLLELTYTDDLADAIQDSICSDFYGDPDLLNNLATAYVTNEMTGYIALDKFTGQLTAAGYYYEGTHTIEGYDFPLTYQIDRSVESPALGAYHAITEEMLPEEEPETKPTPLFYHVTGPDGQEMWLFGTIHVGNERTAWLPQEIYDALASSDALALECDSEAFDEQYDADEELQSQVSDAYFYGDGTTIQDHIDPELYETALKYMKATGSYNMNSEYLKTFFWYNSIDNFYLRQGYQLTGDQGIEERLTRFAEDNGIPLREVESSLFQFQMMGSFSDGLAELLLEDCLGYTAQDSWAGTMELYDMWCAGDEAALREMLSDEVDTSEFTEEELAEYQEQLPFIEEYNKAMSYDRNDGMLDVAIEYLESGETVFYAVGLAHLLNDHNGLVDSLRTAGYTVELVEFAQ